MPNDDVSFCSLFAQYFVFDFHMAPVMLFDKIITLSVSGSVFTWRE